ncbi:hypothetical protein ACJMK2_011683 [Sinanodonta woodiana]|uniref:Uncharacterized protein n=1 Tax=Sinanodonta woodiana TaxID=1069815 RepID=A0ABD3V8U7_SINWO
MEHRIVYILGTIVLMFYISEARPYLIDKPEADSQQDEIMAADEIPNYMTTKDISAFQDPDHNSMGVIAEDKINQKFLVPKSATAPNRRVKRQIICKLCMVPIATVLMPIPCCTRG